MPTNTPRISPCLAPYCGGTMTLQDATWICDNGRHTAPALEAHDDEALPAAECGPGALWLDG
ncbi:hypothetical protein AAEX63_16130 [Luteococcus sp. H138]|uniref:hypothetical protein n=1 Tax=Luteococcus sp. H138 TaxID=3139404 RepID=UPI00313B3C80